MSKEIGITVRKDEDFSEWYAQVVVKSELADYSAAKGFVVLKPYGYEVWEKIKGFIDKRIRKTGHRNAYFPALIPESLLKKEAEHFKGFTPEVFWVTHAGDDPIGERLAVRPTSETIAYASYAKWIKSWRDLPLLLNFWNSVLRAEIKMTKPFIRTSEFLWQEGHTVHETKEDCDREVMGILELYRELVEDHLAIPTIRGFKTDRDKFVGALYTTTLESVMPDGKVLQMGTSHNLGQNFSKPFEIRFIGRDEKLHYAWQASWGVSWRLIGALVMVHGDDKGLILPPSVAPIQAVIIPIFYSREDEMAVKAGARKVAGILKRRHLEVVVDDRDQYTPGWKFNEWELKGVPVRVEVGPREVKTGKLSLVRRDTSERMFVDEPQVGSKVKELLEDVQRSLYKRAEEFFKSHVMQVSGYTEFKRILDEKAGFIKACWCSSPECEERIKEETGAEIRAIAFSGEELFAPCIYCGEKADRVVYFGRAY